MSNGTSGGQKTVESAQNNVKTRGVRHLKNHARRFTKLKPSSDLCQETRPKQILCQESLRRILKCKWEWLIPRDHSAVQERNLQSLDTVSRKYGSTRNCGNDFHFKSELLKPHIFD